MPVKGEDLAKTLSPHDGHVDGISGSYRLVFACVDVNSCLLLVLFRRTEDVDRAFVYALQKAPCMSVAQARPVEQLAVCLGYRANGDIKRKD